jgi:hypothetical protein
MFLVSSCVDPNYTCFSFYYMYAPITRVFRFIIYRPQLHVFFVSLYVGPNYTLRGARIVTRYRPGGPAIDSRWKATFSAPVQTGPGAHPTFCTMGTRSFPGVKWPGRGIDHPLPSSAEVEGRTELHICSPSGPL